MGTNKTRIKLMRPTKAQGQYEETIKNKLLAFRGATPTPTDILKVKRPITDTKPMSETKPLSEVLKDLQDFIKSFKNKRKQEYRKPVHKL